MLGLRSGSTIVSKSAIIRAVSRAREHETHGQTAPQAGLASHRKPNSQAHTAPQRFQSAFVMWRVHIESQTMFETMLELMREQILSPTVHVSNFVLHLGRTTLCQS
jgi:hypothetical protein